MEVRIEGGAPLRGTAHVPADKSILHRALIFNGVVGGEATLRARDLGADNRSTISVLRALGVAVEQREHLHVASPGVGGFARDRKLDCGNSGTTLRLLAGALAGAGIAAELGGDESLARRPMGRVAGPLNALGAAVSGRIEGERLLPPLRIAKSAFRGGHVASDVASAQVKSAVLLAGVAAGQPVSVALPWASRDHSERLLCAMGAQIRTVTDRNGELVTFTPGVHLRSCDVAVPGDFSSAAFVLAAALLVPGSSVRLRDVGLNASRTGLLEILEEYRAGVRVQAWREVAGEAIGDLEANHCSLRAEQPGQRSTVVAGAVIPRLIDELVVLAAVASQAEGTTEIRDAHELRVKESDRIHATRGLLGAFGVDADEHPDGLVVRGPQPLKAADLDVSADHRIALTAAVLALAAPGTSVLRGFEIASVSYPNIVATLQELGARVTVD